MTVGDSFYGTANDDRWTVSNPGSFTLYGLDGYDILSLGTSPRSWYEVTWRADGGVDVDTVSGASGDLHARLYGVEELRFANQTERLDLTIAPAPAVLWGTSGDDVLPLGATTTEVRGQGGLDTLVVSDTPSGYALSATAGAVSLSLGERSVALVDVERLEIQGKKLALDLDGHAGVVARTIGAVFGATVLDNPALVGVGLTLLDSGQYDEPSLMQLALDVALGADARPGDVVDLLYCNLLGVLPDSQTQAVFVRMLASGAFTPATLGVFAAHHALNELNIDLVGLAQEGLAYV